MESPFSNQDHEPTSEPIKEHLGPSLYRCYEELQMFSEGFARVWQFYPKYGWHLKIFDKKKSLFYLRPLANQLNVSLTLRETERDYFLSDLDFQMLHEQLENARKYPEGYAMKFEIQDESTFMGCSLLIEFLADIRKNGLPETA